MENINPIMKVSHWEGLQYHHDEPMPQFRVTLQSSRENCAANWNLLTNFDRCELPIYETAIKLYGKNDVYIDENAYLPDGQKDETAYALRCTEDRDYSDFWKVFDKVCA